MRKPETYSDTEIIEAIHAGGTRRERMAYYLYKRYMAFPFKLLQKYQNLKEEGAKDVYADAVVALMEQISDGRFRGESKISTYLFRIFSNKCVDFLRKKTTNKNNINWVDEFLHLPDESQDVLKSLVEKNQVAMMEALFTQLGERCQQLLMDSYYWGYSPKELAERMSLKNAETASSMRYKCLQRLRTLCIEKQINPNNE